MLTIVILQLMLLLTLVIGAAYIAQDSHADGLLRTIIASCFLLIAWQVFDALPFALRPREAVLKDCPPTDSWIYCLPNDPIKRRGGQS